MIFLTSKENKNYNYIEIPFLPTNQHPKLAWQHTLGSRGLRRRGPREEGPWGGGSLGRRGHKEEAPWGGVDTIQIDKRINKTWHNRILFSLKKEWRTDSCYNIDIPWQTMVSKSQTQSHIIWVYLHEMSRIDKSVETESRLVVAGTLEREMESDW